MNTSIKDEEKLDAIIDSHLAELMTMSDEQVLDGENSDVLQAAGIKMLDDAITESGRRRLQAAREKLAATQVVSDASAAPTVSAQQARDFLRAVANDSRFTLAARNLDELSDEDALRMYEQLRRLRDSADPSGDET